MIDELIKEGEGLKGHLEDVMGQKRLSGEEYSLWITKSIRFLEKNDYDSELTKKFINSVQIGKSIPENTYYDLLGILKSFKEFK